MKKIRNFVILLRYWKTLQVAHRVWNDPKSNFSTSLSQGLSLEEVDAVQELEVLHRILTLDPGELKRELSAIDRSLNK